MKAYTLPKEFAEKWINALRSGNYKQGKSYLYSYVSNGITGEDRYCCLGVACTLNNIPKSDLRCEFIGQSFFMPVELKGDGSYNNLVRALTDLNDGTHSNDHRDSKSFNEIASWIEQNVEFI